MAFFSIVGNEAQYQKYDNTTSGLDAENTQAAIDELVQDLSDGLAAQNEASEITYDDTAHNLGAANVQGAIDAIADDAVLIDTTILVTGFTRVAENPSDLYPAILFGDGPPSNEIGSDGEFYYDGPNALSVAPLYEKVSGSWVSRDNAFNSNYYPDNTSPSYSTIGDPLVDVGGASYWVRVSPFPPTEQNHVSAVYTVDRTPPLVDAGDIIEWSGTEWVAVANDADAVNYDGTSSGLDATDVQAAIDELAQGLEDQNEASEITYDNETSELAATNVQDAIDELVEDLGELSEALDEQDEASEITYDNVTSELVATNVQDAIDELVEALDGQNEASEITYDNVTSELVATNVQDAIDELADDAVLIDTDQTQTVFNLLADAGDQSPADCLVGSSSPTTEGNDGDFYWNTDGENSFFLWEKIEGTWTVREGYILQGGAFDQESATATVDANPGDYYYVVVASPAPPVTSGDFLEVYTITENVPSIGEGDIIVWDSNESRWITSPNNSGGSPQPYGWIEAVGLSFYSGSGAPSVDIGAFGGFYLDTVEDELYGPKFYDFELPGFSWGDPTPITVSENLPSNEDSGEYYVVDNSGNYSLFKNISSLEGGEVLYNQNGNIVGAPLAVRGDQVFTNLDFVLAAADVGTRLNVNSQFASILSNMDYSYLGGRSYYAETNINTTYEINAYDGNGFVLTLTDDTEISFTDNLNSLSTYNLGTRFAELTIVLIQDSTGSHVVTWDAAVKVSANTTLTTTANAVDMLKAVSWDDGATWYVTQIGANFT